MATILKGMKTLISTHHLVVVNRERPNIYRIEANIDSTNSATKYKNSSVPIKFSIDFSSLPATIPANSKIYIDFNLVSFKFEVSRATGQYVMGTIPYSYVKGDSNDVVDVLDLNTSPYDTSSLNFPLEGVYIEEEILFSSPTTRGFAINSITDALESGLYTSIVNANKNDQTEANLIQTSLNVDKARIWWSGFANFKIDSDLSVSTPSGVVAYSLQFSSAEIYPSQLTVWQDSSPLPLTGKI